MGDRDIDWDTVRDEYEGHIASYVGQCPFHLFDARRNRVITRSELKDDIITSFVKWIKVPLTCGEIMDIISHCPIPGSRLESTLGGWKDEIDEIRPYVVSAMARNPVIEDDGALFLSTLNDALQDYDSMPRDHMPEHMVGPPSVPVHPILLSVRDLINAKRSGQISIPSHLVQEQIALLGQYAILSHRWYPDGQELSFTDVANFSDPNVQAKEGFRKLAGFAGVVQSYYGCHYLWMDSACISEPDRAASIPLMFGWYRHAYVCVIYLSTSPTVLEDPWSTRGWTLQEVIAANKIICFTKDWRPVNGETGKFHADRGNDTKISPVYNELVEVTGSMNWHWYKPNVYQIFDLLKAMRTRETAIPEDMVYSLLSALDIDIPVKYGEGFDRAFYRFQVKYLTQTNDRRLLSWRGGSSSPYNSMLAGSFMVDISWWWTNFENMYRAPPIDPTISFDSKGVMRIMASLHPLHSTSPSQPQAFALLGGRGSAQTRVGVMLVRCTSLPGHIYRRIGLGECDESIIQGDKAPEWVFIK